MGADVIVATTNRLNLGCGKFPLEGWTNVDSDLDSPADVWCDFRTADFRDLDEVRMSHVLEHLSWRETGDTLRRIKTWMIPGGKLTIEVPDMDLILALGTGHPLWFKYIYGDQTHEGEFHRAGFTEGLLRTHLLSAAFYPVTVECFVSDHQGRIGMPCLLAEATA